MEFSSQDEWTGDERRGKGRIIYSRGPVIIGLELASAITSILALISIVLAIILFAAKTDAIISVNYKTCRLIVDILHSFHTVRGRENAQFIITHNPRLGNCYLYARSK